MRFLYLPSQKIRKNQFNPSYPCIPENGIFLTDDQGQTRKMPNIVENKPARLIVMIPADLPAGTYTVEVRTSFMNTTKEGKNIKTGRFNRELVALMG